jgi:DNA-binding XRE family transcriptional regulator
MTNGEMRFAVKEIRMRLGLSQAECAAALSLALETSQFAGARKVDPGELR